MFLVLRFGRSLESFYLASQLVNQNDFIKLLGGLIKTANGCFLFCDHFIVMGRMKMLQVDTQDWTLSASRYWFLTDVLNLVQNYLELKKIYNYLANVKGTENVSRNSSNKMRLLVPIYLDIIKNLVDMFLPLCSLNTIKLSLGTSGLLGMLSSLLGLLLMLKPFSKVVLS